MGFMLSADGRVSAIKQGSGMYGSAGGLSVGQFGGDGPLYRGDLGFASAYTVSTWIYRCIEATCDAIEEVEFDVVETGTKNPVEDHPFLIAIKRNRQDLLRRIWQSQLLYGETFIEKARNTHRTPENSNRGYVSDMYWLNNIGMAVLIGAGFIFGYTYTATNGGSPKNFDEDEIGFMKSFNPFDDLRGMSRVEVVLDEVAIDKNVARVVRAFYANDTRIGLLFIPKRDMSPADSERFMAAFKKDNQGPNKAGKPVLLPSEITVQRAQNPGELDDVQLRESTRREICAAFGVPLAIAGAWDDANYDSVDTQQKSFYQNTIKPACKKIERFINRDLMPSFDPSGRAEFMFKIDELIAGMEDPNEKADKTTKRWQSGEISWNEARRLSGDDEIEGGDDVFCVPSGYTFVSRQQILSGQIVPQPATPEQSMQRALQQELPKIASKTSDVESPVEIITQEIKALTESTDPVIDELYAWERKTKQKGVTKSVGFIAHHIPVMVQEFVRGELNDLEQSDLILDMIQPARTYKTIFADARAVIVSIKAVTPAQQDFIKVFKTAVNGALADIVSRRSFGTAMRQALKQYGTQAYLEGFGETELDEIGKFSVDTWLMSQSQYVTSFADELFSSGLSPAEVDNRAALWAGNSIGEIYLDGLVRGKKDKRYRWEYKEESEHCNSCIKLNMQVHRLSQWYARNLRPKSDVLDCGLGCNCTMTETDEPATGRFL